MKNKTTQLQDSLHRLEQENAALKRRSEESERLAEETIKAHKEAIDAANEIATNYRAAIYDVKVAKKKYETEINQLLKKLRKQKGAG